MTVCVCCNEDTEVLRNLDICSVCLDYERNDKEDEKMRERLATFSRIETHAESKAVFGR